MRHYAVTWVLRGRGAYRAADPVTTFDGGYGDLHGMDIIYAQNGKVAADLLKQARPGITKVKARLLVA